MTEKPECVGCGFCCIQQRCSQSIHIFGGPISMDCPALIWVVATNRYRCAIIPEDTFAYAYLEIGSGCLVPTNWRFDVKPRKKSDVRNAIRYHTPSPELMDLLKRNGVV